MRKTFYVEETMQNGDTFWKTLCVVFDNEALGLMERLLIAAGWKFKVDEEWS